MLPHKLTLIFQASSEDIMNIRGSGVAERERVLGDQGEIQTRSQGSEDRTAKVLRDNLIDPAGKTANVIDNQPVMNV